MSQLVLALVPLLIVHQLDPAYVSSVRPKKIQGHWSAILFFGASPKDGIGELIKKWKSENAEVRDQVSREILSRWKEWSEADLLNLKRAALDQDAEVAGRAREVQERIQIRHKVVGTRLEIIQGLEDTVFQGGRQQRLELINEAGILWYREKLTDSDLLVLVRLIQERNWMLESEGLMRVTKVDLGDIGGTCPVRPYLELIIPLLKEKQPGTRAWALQFIGDSRPPQVDSSLVAHLLEDESGPVRARAAEALGRLNADKYKNLIALRLADAEEDVRTKAAEALGILRAREFGDRIVLLAKDGKSDLAQHAGVIALGLLGAHEYAPELIPLLKSKDRDRRLETIKTLGRMGARAQALNLVPLLLDEDLNVKWETAKVLARLGASDQVDRIVPLLMDPYRYNRAVAAEVLGLLNATDKRDKLVPLLTDVDWEVRWHTVTAFGQLGVDKYAAEVSRLLQDPQAEVRSPAALALANVPLTGLSPEMIRKWIDELEHIRRDPQREVREAASIAFVRFSSSDRPHQLKVLEMLAYAPKSPAFRAYSGVLAEHHEMDRYKLIHRKTTLSRSIESWEDLEKLFEEAGMRLKSNRLLKICGRIPDGILASPHQVLQWAFADEDFAVVFESNGVQLKKSAEVLEYWRKRLAR